MKVIVRLLVLSLAFWGIAACTTNQSIKLSEDGSGTATIRLEVKKLFADYFKEDNSAKIFDPAKIEKGLEKRPGFTVNKITTPTPESLEMELSFKDLRFLFSDKNPPDNDGIISITKKDGKTTLAIHLDRKTAKQVGELFADVSNPAFGEMSPRKQRTRTEKEYFEAVEFAVGKEGPSLMKSCYVKLTVRADGEIVSQTGGKLEGGAAVFQLPLMSMLMLESPLSYSVTFAPDPKTRQKPRPKSK